METGDFDAFYAATAQRIGRQIYLVTGEISATQDAVHHAYAQAWERWATVSQLPNPEAWVRATAAHNALNPWRELQRRLSLRRSAADREIAAAKDADQIALLNALSQLPPRQRLAMVLHHVCGRNATQIAAEMESTVGAAQARLLRGRDELADQLPDLAERDVNAEDPLSARLTEIAERLSPRLLTAATVRALSRRRAYLVKAGGLLLLLILLGLLITALTG